MSFLSNLGGAFFIGASSGVPVYFGVFGEKDKWGLLSSPVLEEFVIGLQQYNKSAIRVNANSELFAPPPSHNRLLHRNQVI